MQCSCGGCMSWKTLNTSIRTPLQLWTINSERPSTTVSSWNTSLMTPCVVLPTNDSGQHRHLHKCCCLLSIYSSVCLTVVVQSTNIHLLCLCHSSYEDVFDLSIHLCMLTCMHTYMHVCSAALHSPTGLPLTSSIITVLLICLRPTVCENVNKQWLAAKC